MEYAQGKKEPQPIPAKAHRSEPQGTERQRAKITPTSQLIVQAKMSVGPVHDPLEREADVMASRVVRMLRSTAAASEPAPAKPTASRVQRAAVTGAAGGPLDRDTERAVRSASGGGAALPENARTKMEYAFGASFSGVRVHVGSKAADLNDRIQAKAFTTGNNIFFRDGLPDANTANGQALLAHELTHTIQQGGSGMQRAQRLSIGLVQRWPARASNHFKERAAERGITEREADDAFAGGQTHVDTDSGAKVYWDQATKAALIMSADGRAFVTCYKQQNKKGKWQAV